MVKNSKKEKYKSIFIKDDTAELLNEVKGILLQRNLVDNTTNDETIKAALKNMKVDLITGVGE